VSKFKEKIAVAKTANLCARIEPEVKEEAEYITKTQIRKYSLSE